MNVFLLPGQKIDAYTLITMPARGPSTRLRAKAADGNPLEFSVGTAVITLKPPLADPADPTGTSALAEVPVAIGETLQLGNFSATAGKVLCTRDMIQETAPGKGSQFLVATLRVKNQAPVDQPLLWHSFEFSLRAPDGDETPWNQELLAAGRDDTVDMTVKPGREATVRIYFEVPVRPLPQSLSVREGANGRVYLVDVSSVR